MFHANAEIMNNDHNVFGASNRHYENICVCYTVHMIIFLQ